MPRLLSPRPLAAVAVVVVALALGACSQDEDVSKEQFLEDFQERTEQSEEVSSCITDAIFDDYDQPEINRIYRAATEDELGNERRDELVAINDRCGLENPSDDEGDDTTTTTEADG